MIGRKAEEVLNRAFRFAIEQNHEYFTLEHVLLSLLEDPEILEVIRAVGGSYTEMKSKLEDYVAREVPKHKREETADATGEDAREESKMPEQPIATLGIQRLMQRALFQVQSAGKDEIEPEDLLVALFQAKDSYALQLFRDQKIERLDVLKVISHGDTNLTTSLPAEKDPSGSPVPSQEKRRPLERPGNDPLQQYTVNLNEQAAKGKIDPLVGRQKELDRMIQILCRRRKNNPILIGEAGVGKTALAEGLALRIQEGEVPSLLAEGEVYSLDIGALLAGAKFRGDFEQRLKRVLQSLEIRKEKGKFPVLFIDEIHTIIGAGAVTGGVLDAANLLKPFLSKGEVRCIGSTTYEEYRTVFDKDHALSRRFQKVEIVEPTVEETVQILHGLKPQFEEHHGVTYTDAAVRSAAELAAKHINDRFLPDKAIDVMDEAGAKERLSNKDDDHRPEIDKTKIEDIVASIARIPARQVTTSQKARLKSLDRDLKLAIYGQDHAVEALVSAIRLARSGLRSGDKPVGSFLFCGPTGVGKTELSKQLAQSLAVPFLRFDMSEYMEKHTVSRLIGAPPGYVGFEQAGLLTDGVRKNPYSVVLLDEIEKAHPDVWNILLQVMDHGALTDNNGKKADFRNVILIMTSNVGSYELDRNPLGMSGLTDDAGPRAKSAVERTFSPEFRNRLDATIYFNPLDPVSIGMVVGKHLMELENQLLAKGVEAEFDPLVREWLARKGYDRKMGARPMARLVQDAIRRPLSEEILFGRLEHGGRAEVSLDEKADTLVFKYESRARRDEDADAESHVEASGTDSEE